MKPQVKFWRDLSVSLSMWRDTDGKKVTILFNKCSEMVNYITAHNIDISPDDVVEE